MDNKLDDDDLASAKGSNSSANERLPAGSLFISEQALKKARHKQGEFTETDSSDEDSDEGNDRIDEEDSKKEESKEESKEKEPAKKKMDLLKIDKEKGENGAKSGKSKKKDANSTRKKQSSKALSRS